MPRSSVRLAGGPLREEYSQRKQILEGTSLVVQWLGLHGPNAGGTGLTPGRGTGVPHASACSLKKRKDTQGRREAWATFLEAESECVNETLRGHRNKPCRSDWASLRQKKGRKTICIYRASSGLWNYPCRADTRDGRWEEVNGGWLGVEGGHNKFLEIQDFMVIVTAPSTTFWKVSYWWNNT